MRRILTHGLFASMMLCAVMVHADHYEDAREALSQDRFLVAAKHLEAAASAGDANSELLYWLGIAYWGRDDAPRTIDAYERAIAADPQEQSLWSLYALENLAMVYTRSERLVDSKRAYEKALTRETRGEWIEKIHTQLAELALAMGTFEADERTEFNKQGQVVGGVGPSMMHTNEPFEIARHTRNPEREVQYYREAILVDPEMYQSYFNLGLALTHLGRYEAAIQWLKKSDEFWKRDTDSNPEGIDKADAHAFLALCYLELGRLEEASQHSEIATRTDNSVYWATLYSLRVKTALGAADESSMMLEGLAIENPEHPETLHALANARLASGDSVGARVALQQATMAIPENHPWMERLRENWNRQLTTLP